MITNRALVGLLALACLSIPNAATAGGMTAQWRLPDGTSAPQGLPLPFRLVVTNHSDEPVSTTVSFDLVSEQEGSPISFKRWTATIFAGSTKTIRGTVVSAQWFDAKGLFRIEARSSDLSVSPARFRVTGAPVPIPRFQDVTAAAGLSTEHRAEVVCDNYSAGAAWGDIEGDGDLDLYLPHQFEGSQLWVNNGGTFVDGAVAAGVTNGSSTGIAAVFADYDNDGDADLYVVNDGPNRLYRNTGSGVFEDVASAAGVDDDGPGSSASWGDYDNDGDLDLYVANWAVCGPFGYTYAPDVLYRNNGDGTFTDQTSLLGPPDATLGAGFQAAWFDYDGDFDQDLYLGNDFGGPRPRPNVLWRNDGPAGSGSWRFTDVSEESGTELSINTMGIGLGDYDRDLDLDMALSNIRATILLANDGDGTFTERGSQARVARPQQRVREPSITWGLAFFDFNNDRWEDLYVAGGSLGQELRPEPQANALFVNTRDRRFADLSAPSGADDPDITRGVAFADYDRDGLVDLYAVNQSGEPYVPNSGFPRLYRNVTPGTRRHWLEVDTVGTLSNSDGCGARLVARIGTVRLLRYVFCGSISLGVGSDPTVHFGLGSGVETLDRLAIRWPSGTVQVLEDIAVDQLLTVTEPS